MAVGGVGSAGSGGAMSSSRQTIADNFDTFLQLLTTQLKNQNPLDPLDTNQFTQQLVQFTSVEQQLKTNDFLEAMMQSTQNNANSQAVSYVGKVVTASGTKSELIDGAASWNFALEEDASIEVNVRDKDGNVVFTKRGEVGQGESIFNWDGMGNDGSKQPDGSYTITIEARNDEGQLVEVATEMTGVVTGVDFSGSEPVLLVGGGRVNLSAVSSVREVPPETEEPPPETEESETEEPAAA